MHSLKDSGCASGKSRTYRVLEDHQHQDNAITETRSRVNLKKTQYIIWLAIAVPLQQQILRLISGWPPIQRLVRPHTQFHRHVSLLDLSELRMDPGYDVQNDTGGSTPLFTKQKSRSLIILHHRKLGSIPHLVCNYDRGTPNS